MVKIAGAANVLMNWHGEDSNNQKMTGYFLKAVQGPEK